MNAITATEKLSRTAVAAGGAVSAIIPQDIDQAWVLAGIFAASGCAPQSMKSREQVMVAIVAGAELGMPPFQAMQSFAVINNRPSIWGDAIPALLWSNGFEIDESFDDEDNPTKAFCVVTRPSGKKVSRQYSLADAKKAGLAGKTGPWQTATKRMLQMRARGFAARDGAADVLRGMNIAEEAQDIEPREVAPVATPAEALQIEATKTAQIEIVDEPADDQPEAPAEIADAAIEETIAKARDMFPEDEPVVERDENTDDMFPGDK